MLIIKIEIEWVMRWKKIANTGSRTFRVISEKENLKEGNMEIKRDIS